MENMTGKNHKTEERHSYHSHSLGAAASAKEGRQNAQLPCNMHLFLLQT